MENSTKNLLTSLTPSVYDANKFSEKVRELDFNITMDITHLGQSNQDIIDFFLKNKKFIKNIYLSNFENNILKCHLPLGKGNLSIERFLNVLKKNKYSGVLTLEVNDNKQNVAESVKFVKKVLYR